VTSLRYLPSDDDVLKARLKTVGVSEYKFDMEIHAGRDSVSEWRIIDVGGSRSQRREPISLLHYPRITSILFDLATWVPFFDDGDATLWTSDYTYTYFLPLNSGRHHLPGAYLRF